ncbi:hypothetical protein GCM10023194_46360 [Planotetraspora phitsanulokensis]|uniref:Uncharacterized protein n=1 Tax=Planotetraspora phitsanulokensis TaxID=575192 RepID=A0A8J3UA46_9ACTN|nr:hypothetical protein Pph01_60830 [Planotetraspora phitsanulokensis]
MPATQGGGVAGCARSLLVGGLPGGRTVVRIAVNPGQIKGKIAKAPVNNSRHQAVAPPAVRVGRVGGAGVPDRSPSRRREGFNPDMIAGILVIHGPRAGRGTGAEPG